MQAVRSCLAGLAGAGRGLARVELAARRNLSDRLVWRTSPRLTADRAAPAPAHPRSSAARHRRPLEGECRPRRHRQTPAATRRSRGLGPWWRSGPVWPPASVPWSIAGPAGLRACLAGVLCACRRGREPCTPAALARSARPSGVVPSRALGDHAMRWLNRRSSSGPGGPPGLRAATISSTTASASRCGGSLREFRTAPQVGYEVQVRTRESRAHARDEVTGRRRELLRDSSRLPYGARRPVSSIQVSLRVRAPAREREGGRHAESAGV